VTSLRAAVVGTASWVSGAAAPTAALLPAALRRRTSTLTRAVVEVAGAAAQAADVALAELPVVVATDLGELVTTVDLLAMMNDGDGALSPTKFHNSVHNTASAYLGIATGNRRPATAVAAGAATCGVGLLEAALLLQDGHAHVLLILADEPVPAPLPGPAVGAWEALALVLGEDLRRGRRLELRFDPPARDARAPVGEAGVGALRELLGTADGGSVRLGAEPSWTVVVGGRAP
jgi:hypothetical protein